MASKKGTKRAAAAAAAAPAVAPQAKQQKVNPMVAAMKDTIMDAELSDACKDMLVKMIPYGFSTASGERHPHQELVIKMAGQVIDNLQAKMKQEIGTASADVSSANAVQAELDSKVSEAEALLTAAADVVATKKTKLAAAIDEESRKASALVVAEAAQREGDAPLTEAKKEKEVFEAAFESDFKVLQSGDAAEPKVHHDAVMLHIKMLNIDASLLTSFPLVCMKPCAERGPFDGMVMLQVEKILTDHIATLAATLEAGIPASAERKAAVESAQQELTDARAMKDEATIDFNAAEASYQEVAAAAAAAKEVAACHGPTCTTAAEALEQKQSALKGFQEWNVACFETLRDKSADADVHAAIAESAGA